MRYKHALLVLPALALAPFSTRAAIIYVRGGYSPVGDGAAWSKPLATVQAAISRAASGDEIWVAAAVYKERITLKPNVSLYGGFTGQESTRDARNPRSSGTILDGDAKGSVVTIPATVTATTVLDGFVVRNGTGTLVSGLTSGGGIYCNGGSPTLSHLAVTGNTARDLGGGIFIVNSSAVITNTVVSGNKAATGGGIYAKSTSMRFRGSVVRANTAGATGGGYYGTLDTSALVGNTFVSNAAPDGGGIKLDAASTTLIANSIFAFNSSGISQDVTLNTPAKAALRANCIYGNVVTDVTGLVIPTGVKGGIAADPRLVLDAAGVPHIQPDSPCRDAADNSLVLPGDTDIDGMPQMGDGHVDIGADECDGTIRTPASVVIRVSPAGADASDGLTWASAKKTVAAAVKALGTGSGELWVAAGIYAVGPPSTTGVVAVGPDVSIYGGFAGTETVREQRDWARNVSILDAGGRGHVLTVSAGAGRTTVIDGLTLRNGNGVDAATTFGGGISCAYAAPIISHNTIRANSAATGGGIYANLSAPLIVDNVFTGNTASLGAAVALRASTATVANNTIVANRATDGGGGYVVRSTVLFANNIVAYNGAGVYQNDAPANDAGAGQTFLTFRNNCFFDNLNYDVKGLADPTGSGGNIHKDPLLAAVPADLHLHLPSPCRDAGDGTVTAPGELDIDGQPRLQGSQVDIGADESNGAAPAPSPPPVVRVSPAGSDTNDGSDWTKAKKTLKAALASVGATGGEIWLAADVYPEYVIVPSFVTVYGGFAGTEADRTQRDFRKNITVLDGQSKGTVVTISAGTMLAGLDGVTVRNGLNNNSYLDAAGGVSASGALFTVSNTIFQSNQAPRGGAIYVKGGIASVSNCWFVGNRAIVAGGAVYIDGATANITDAAVSQNAAGVSGAGFFLKGSMALIRNTTVVGSAAPDGAAFDVHGPGTSIVNSIVADNTSGLRADSANVTLRADCFYENTSYGVLGLPDPSGRNGNLNVDPHLADPLHGNLHLQPTSACRDAGDTAAVLPDEQDLDGQPRIQGGGVDIGVDESDLRLWRPSLASMRVSPSGSDANDGSTWTSAKRTVQAAVDALPAGNGEVWVSAGVYAERVTLRTGTALYGGFAGSESLQSQRRWASNLSVLDGQALGSVVTIPSGVTGAVVDGFTIRNGRAVIGAGILCRNASAVIEHNVITGNRCDVSSGSLDAGAGIGLDTATAVIDNNLIRSNTALGAGVGIWASLSVATVVNNTIAANAGPSGTYDAGGALGENSSSLAATNNVVAFNSSGIYGSADADLQLANNCVFGNGLDYVNVMDVTGFNGSISTDPQFVDRLHNDYHLLPTSPCVDSGKDPGLFFHALDLDGDLRPQGAAWDIGTDETPGLRQVAGLPVVYVSTAGSDANSGATWTSPKKTLGSAIDAALAPGGEVWVAGGQYAGRVILQEGVSLYGGFQGNETSRAARGGTTTLVPPAAGTVIIVPSNVTRATVLDGFQISGGAATYQAIQGGGITCLGSPTVRNNTFTSNSGYLAAAVYCGPGTAPLVDGNRFSANVVPYSSAASGLAGGVVYCDAASAIITNNTFTANAGTTSQMTVCVGTQGGSPMIASNVMSDNGGGVVCSGGTPSILYNAILRNTLGIQTSGAAVTIANNAIHDNVGNAGNYGGGVVVILGTASIRDNVLSGNGVGTSYVGQNIGGALRLTSATASVTNNTFTGNNAGLGGCVNIAGGSIVFANNILAFNGAGLSFNSNVPGILTLQANCAYGNRDFDYSGVADPTGLNGNVKADPQFANFLAADFHIQPSSPCRDAGDDSAVLPGDTDADGQSRILGAHVDIGADESDGTVWSGAARVVRVRADGNDSNNGSSWALAKKTIQAASDAISYAGGGEIWVAAGSYSEFVFLRSFTSLYGGFVGNEATVGQRDWKRNTTTVLGQPQNYAGQLGVGFLGGSMYSTLDGFTVRGADLGNIGNGGGVVFYENASGTVRHSVITNNLSTGIYLQYSSSALIRENVISSNGGGAVVAFIAKSALILNNQIVGNSGNDDGGTIDLYETRGVVANNVVAGNIATVGGILYCESGYPVLVANNTFAGNSTPRGTNGFPTWNGTISASGAGSRIVNNIIAFNTTGIQTSPASAATIGDNCVYGNSVYDYNGIADQTGRNGNVKVDPLVAGIAFGNLHIQPGSPCIDAGDDTVVASDWLDMDGQPRILGAHVDIGADESDGALWPSTARIVRVKPDGNDLNDGSSWGNAKRSVQSAVNSFADVMAGGDVWVASGVYAEHLALGPFVSLYGGFRGTETDRAQRDAAANATILDGGHQGPVIIVRSGSVPSVLDGFTVRNGYATTTTPTDVVPAGIDCRDSALRIANNVFSQNTGQYSVALYVLGGTPIIESNRFTANFNGIWADRVTATIRNNTLENSDVRSGGGPSVIRGNTIRTGAIHMNGAGIVSNNTLTDNSAGSAVIKAGEGNVYGSSVSVLNNLVVDLGPNAGVGIYLDGDMSGLVANNTVVESSTQSSRGILVSTSGNPSIINNIVTGAWGGVDTFDVPNGYTGVFRNNDVYGNSTNYSGTDMTGTNGNVSIAPQFAKPGGGDYHLQNGSPCVDAGYDGVVQPDSTDIDGQPRIQGAHVDIGADEAVPAMTLMEVARALRIAGGLEAAATDAPSVGEGQPGVTPLPLNLAYAAECARTFMGLDSAP